MQENKWAYRIIQLQDTPHCTACVDYLNVLNLILMEPGTHGDVALPFTWTALSCLFLYNKFEYGHQETYTLVQRRHFDSILGHSQDHLLFSRHKRQLSVLLWSEYRGFQELNRASEWDDGKDIKPGNLPASNNNSVTTGGNKPFCAFLQKKLLLKIYIFF